MGTPYDPKQTVFPAWAAVRSLMVNILGRPHFISYTLKHGISLKLCKMLYRPVTAVWTVRSPEEMEQARKNGFDWIIFEGFRP